MLPAVLAVALRGELDWLEPVDTAWPNSSNSFDTKSKTGSVTDRAGVLATGGVAVDCWALLGSAWPPVTSGHSVVSAAAGWYRARSSDNDRAGVGVAIEAT
ncbi:hypothetical protein GCM10023321_72970 [Pseudonocardia eucalypti]|uniref:Uncharacterized protein n=1 Tax=Pseudonocardia eucalypti TaxID=648755 RepID=A0ABP9R8G5_9PSEU|nr:hypothetical protein [Pseudonocardia eucalypti]